MFTRENLKELIAKLEHQKQQEPAVKALNYTDKTFKVRGKILQQAWGDQSVEPDTETKKFQYPVEKEMKKLSAKRLAELNKHCKNYTEVEMRNQGLKSYKLACKIKNLEIPQLSEGIEKELEKAQNALGTILNRKDSLEAGSSEILSKSYEKKFQALLSFAFNIASARDKLIEKCTSFKDLYKQFFECRKSEVAKVSTSIESEPGDIKNQNFILEEMINFEMVKHAAGLIDKLKKFHEELEIKKLEILKGTIMECTLERAYEKTSQERTFEAQESEKQKQDFLLALKQAEEQGQQLAKKEADAEKPQVAVVAQEKKLEDEETLIIELREFLNERIASSRKGLQDFDKETVEVVERTFHHVFKTKELFGKLGSSLTKKQSTFLQNLYKSNEQYYLSIKQYIELLKTPMTLIEWSRLLEKIRALDIARFEDAKKELEKLDINDSEILTKLLVPVYRLVFKFQKEQLLPLTRQISETEVRILCAKRAGLLSSSSSSSKSTTVRTKSTANDDLKKIFEKNLSPLEIVSEVSCIMQKIQQDILRLRAKTDTVSDSSEASETVMTQSPVLPEVSFSSENFISDVGLLKTAEALNIINDLFSRNPTVCYKDFYNMLRILRGENSVTDPLSGHVMFQFPLLWGGMRTVPQVTVGIYHKSGMPTASQIQDLNILRDLRNACREAGMTPSVIESIQGGSKNLEARQSQADIVEAVAETVSSEKAQPNRKAQRALR